MKKKDGTSLEGFHPAEQETGNLNEICRKIVAIPNPCIWLFDFYETEGLEQGAYFKFWFEKAV